MAPRIRQQSTMEAFTTITKSLPNNISITCKKRKQSLEEDFKISTPKKQRCTLDTNDQTPTRALKSLRITSTPLKCSVISSSTSISLSAKRKRATTPEILDDNQLEDLLQHLNTLCIAFLSTLALQYAHNGSSSSIDCRRLIPSLTKAWGVRKVTLIDIRRILALMQTNGSTHQPSFANTFTLKDYGSGRVHVELKSTASMRSRIGHVFDEADLRRKFQTNLDKIWKAQSDVDCDTFLSSLPLQPLTESTTIAKVANLTFKGQRRLEEVLTPFKRISITEPETNDNDSDNDDNSNKTNHPPKRTRTSLPSPPPTTSSTPSPQVQPQVQPILALTPAARATQLLARIRTKETHAASQPSGPSASQLGRAAALHRCVQILPVLTALATGRSSSSSAGGAGGMRASFPMAALVASVQGSLASPVAREEVLACVREAERVFGGFVRVVCVGGMTGVVVDLARRVPLGDVQRRVAEEVERVLRGD